MSRFFQRYSLFLKNFIVKNILPALNKHLGCVYFEEVKAIRKTNEVDLFDFSDSRPEVVKLRTEYYSLLQKRGLLLERSVYLAALPGLRDRPMRPITLETHNATVLANQKFLISNAAKLSAVLERLKALGTP
jgi:hypothetical protein